MYIWYSIVAQFGFVCSRMLWIKFKFAKVKVYVEPTEGDEERREKFWSDFGRVWDRLYIVYRLCIGWRHKPMR